MDNTPIRLVIAAVAEALGPLKDRCVLTGGAVTSLYLTDPQELAPRITRDVDVIVKVSTRHEYYEEIEAGLRSQGFQQGGEDDDPLCRWHRGALICDVMPTDPGILGFSNEWYLPGFDLAEEMSITDACSWKAMPVVYFFASKLTAFFSRGMAEPESSQDLEDVVSLINGRLELATEVAAAEAQVRAFIAESSNMIVASSDIMDILPGHLAPDPISQQRLALVKQRLREMAAL